MEQGPDARNVQRSFNSNLACEFLFAMKCATNINFFQQLPFPAITICPESKTDIKKFNLTYVLSLVSSKKNLTRYETNGLNALYQICDIITENVNDSVRNL